MTAQQDAVVARIIDRFVERHPTAVHDAAERALLDQLSSALRGRFRDADLDPTDPTVRRAALLATDLVLRAVEQARITCGTATFMHMCTARAVAAWVTIEQQAAREPLPPVEDPFTGRNTP